jgi:hypothetical protein
LFTMGLALGVPPLYLITRQRAFYLRLDDIQCFALIYLRKCDIINSPINWNLTITNFCSVIDCL